MSDYLLGIDAVVPSAALDELPDDPGLVAERALAEVRVAPGSALRPFGAESAPAAERVLESALEGVSDAAWTDFVLSMKVAEPGAVSASNELGMFGSKPRRLGDLELMKNLRCTRANQRAVWVGDFVSTPPAWMTWKGSLSKKKFLSTPALQYEVFSESMRRYVDGLRDGSIPRPDGGRPEGMTLSGILAILHRAGPLGLKSWNDEGRRFSDTVDLYEKVNGIF